MRVPRGWGSGKSGNAGCVLVLVLLAAFYVVVRAVIALFSTPIPYVAMALCLAAMGGIAVYRQLQRKWFLDAVAALHGHDEAPPSAPDCLWRRAGDEPDTKLLRAAHFAALGNHAGAANLLATAPADWKKLGRLSGPISLWFPGLIEPLQFGRGEHATHNLRLAQAYEAALGGDPAAEATLQQRLHEPQFATAVGALAEAYAANGRHDLAARTLEQNAHRVTDPGQGLALRYKWASYQAASGNVEQAHKSFLALGAYHDAQAQAAALGVRVAENAAAASAARHQRDLAQKHQLELQVQTQRRAEEEEDELVYAEALDRIKAARGPRTREKALEWGLARIRGQKFRRHLAVDASRVEAHAVLDRVAGLKTKAAKRRNLEEALDRLRSDTVPDEQQGAELGALEDALQALEDEA